MKIKESLWISGNQVSVELQSCTDIIIFSFASLRKLSRRIFSGLVPMLSPPAVYLLDSVGVPLKNKLFASTRGHLSCCGKQTLRRMPSPLQLLLASAVAFGCLATLFVIVSISVDGWQKITFDDNIIRNINETNDKLMILSLSTVTQFFRIIDTSGAEPKEYIVHSSTNGLWRTCDHLSDADRQAHKGLLNRTVTESHCFIFVTDYDEESLELSKGAKQVARLHNSASSCYIVVLIDLSSAVVVGLVGIYHKQVASCMVTGVLYFMAALFGLFGLAMFHTKHYYEAHECKTLDPMPNDLCEARQVQILYAIPLAWLGVILCILACTLWLLFARALRVIISKTML